MLRPLVSVILIGAAVAAATGKEAGPTKWRTLFDGTGLDQWETVEKYDFKRHGRVDLEDARLVLRAGSPGTAVRWTGQFPRSDYEVSLEAMRVEGNDFFCGMTFPVGDKALTLVVGGWGGSVTGLSSINGEPAVENETCSYVDYEQGRWYGIRLRVTASRVNVWIDDEQIIDLPLEHRQLSIYWEVEPCLPFGIATWRTTGALRNVRVRSLEAADAARVHPF